MKVRSFVCEVEAGISRDLVIGFGTESLVNQSEIHAP